MRWIGLSLVLMAPPAWSWPLPVADGTATSVANASTLAITTTVDAPVGSFVVCFVANNSTTGVNSMTDSAGNTWSMATNQTTNGRSRFGRAPVTVDLAPGATITVTYAATNTNPKLASCAVVYNPASTSIDQNATATAGTSTTPSITGTTPVVNPELVFGGIIDVGGAGDTFTEPAGWIALPSATSTGLLHLGYYFACNPVAATYNPTINNSRSWGENMLSFRMPYNLSSAGAGVC